MLGGLLKAAWKSDSAEKRRSAVRKMKAQDNVNQSIFEQLALNDPDQSVRQACLEQLRRIAPLFRAYIKQDDAVTKAVAKKAFAGLLRSSEHVTSADVEALLLEHNEATTLVAQSSPDPTLRRKLLDSLTQVEQADLIADINYAETRFYIAEQLDQLEALELARRNLKGKDKNSEKVIRSKLEEYRSQKKLENEVNESALALCEKMEFIANHPQWRPEFTSKYEQCMQHWSSLSLQPEAFVADRFKTAAQAAQVEVDAQRERERIEKSQLSITDKLERYCATLAPLNLAELAREQLSINTILADASDTWLDDGDHLTPDSRLTEKFLAAQRALRSASDLVECTSCNEVCTKKLASRLSALSWPANYTEFSAKAEAVRLLNDLEQQSSLKAKQKKSKLDALHKRINRLLGTSNKGDVKKAKHELSATTKAASHYSGKERKTLDERLEMATKLVSKMSDWQNFAIEPKLLALSDAMERLVGAKSHPDKLSQEISKLQNKWKNLGHTDITDEYWPRFKTAADLAYAPCADFFQQRGEIRKDNLSKREPLVAQMQKLLDSTDWDATPDYKQVETSLRNINNSWRKIKDVERIAGQKQWNRFSAIKDLIYQKLDPVYDTNMLQKEKLIAQVDALAEGSVNDDSLEKLKLFQNRWKQVGVTRRKQDQHAWARFRAAGDALFEKVKGARNEKRAVEDQQLKAYRDIINQIHALAKSATNLADADAEFDKLEASYKLLPPLPKALPEKLIERLAADYKRAEEAFSQARDRIIQASKNETLSALRVKADLCGKLEIAITKKDNAQISALEQQIENTIIADKSLEARFKIRLNSARETDKSAANHARRLLCIELEILLDVSSPQEDKALRMQTQLERMKTAGIGHTSVARKNDITELTLDWLCSPGAEPELQKNLEKRFEGLVKQI